MSSREKHIQLSTYSVCKCVLVRVKALNIPFQPNKPKCHWVVGQFWFLLCKASVIGERLANIQQLFFPVAGLQLRTFTVVKCVAEFGFENSDTRNPC